MAKGVNKAILLGNVGKDPDIRSTQSGMTIASFSLATADRKKGSGGEWEDVTEWHNLVAFERTAEIIRDYVKKGSQLMIIGKITQRSWDDKDSGQKRYKTEIIVNELTLLGGPKDEGAAGQRASNSGYGRQASTPEYADQGITDDDIPF